MQNKVYYGRRENSELSLLAVVYEKGKFGKNL